MSQQLINRSQDLKRLQDEGYELEIRGGYLLMHHIPYVDHQRITRFGTLVSELNLAGNSCTARPNNHVIYFMGDNPCNNDGTIISGIQHGNNPTNFGSNIVVNRSFSNKPAAGYSDYYEKFTRYADIISAPAIALNDQTTAKTFKVILSGDEPTVFLYTDTNSSRAHINNINAKLEQQQVGIIGLGGTGSYVLDLIAKTPVREIHLFDGDLFLQHNAFRSPGAPGIPQLGRQETKANYFAALYSHMRKGIIPHAYFLAANNLNELAQCNFVFLCIDNNQSREMICKYLLSQGITFIDAGLGINRIDDQLIGSVRVTTATSEKSDHLEYRLPHPAGGEDEYATNIQIADLNCLNAAMAVIKWKKLLGFYQDLEKEFHCSYEINVSKIFNDDNAA